MIDSLMQILEAKEVKIIYRDLHVKNPLLEALVWPSKYLVILDKSLLCRPRQFKCVLGEETGHILYPPHHGGIEYHLADYWKYDFLKRSQVSHWNTKNERTALFWATSFLIPDDEFWEFAQEGPHDWWEWLERFDVEDWFMKRKIDFMRTKANFKWRDSIKRTARKGGFGA